MKQGARQTREVFAASPDERPVRRKTIWIDLDNTPHVPFFRPIIKELAARGYETRVTARDAYQVCDLARHMGITHETIGRHLGKRRLLKMAGVIVRALQLARFALREKPDLALAHGSRSMILTARLLGIPAVTVVDYEHAHHFPGFLDVSWKILPDLIPPESRHHPPERCRTYSGIKEDVYVPAFEPDPSILDQLEVPSGSILATVRPPATEAHYHDAQGEKVFEAVMDLLTGSKGVRIVLLPRNERQAAWIRSTWPHWFSDGRTTIPEHPVDGLNLLWHSDLAVGGGGTMNREAAALNVPVYSTFCGPVGAVDRHLEETGRLVLVRTVEDVRIKVRVEKRPTGALPAGPRPALQQIVGHVEDILNGHNTG